MISNEPVKPTTVLGAVALTALMYVPVNAIVGLRSMVLADNEKLGVLDKRFIFFKAEDSLSYSGRLADKTDTTMELDIKNTSTRNETAYVTVLQLRNDVVHVLLENSPFSGSLIKEFEGQLGNHKIRVRITKAPIKKDDLRWLD